MTITLVGLGLGDEQDVTLKGLNAIREADNVYLEAYTSFLAVDLPDLETLYKKKVIPLSRKAVEQGSLIEEAKTSNVVLLVVGDPFGATTHTALIQEAKENNVDTHVIHNASILTAIGETGLSLYTFGKTVSLPWEHAQVTSTAQGVKDNLSLGMHTLVLLDLHNRTTLRFSDACKYLLAQGIPPAKAIGIVRLGQEGQAFHAGTLESLSALPIDSYPQCLIICGKLHFTEETIFKAKTS